MVKVVYLGHSCFRLELDDYVVILDPYAPGSVPGYSDLKEEADMVLSSHEHADHHGIGSVALRKGKTFSGQVVSLDTWHDEQKGAQRGPNKIHIIAYDGLRLAHLGDLGCDLTEKEIEALKGVDVLMIPVGGFFTIDAAAAKKIARQLDSLVTIPMHYKGTGFGYDVIGRLGDYTRLCQDVKEYGSELAITKEMEKQTAVLKAVYRL